MQLLACLACLAWLSAMVRADSPYQQKSAAEKEALPPYKHLNDFWRSSIYRNVVFFDKKFFVDLPEGQEDQASKIMRQDVPNNAGKLGKGRPHISILEDSNYRSGRMVHGTTCVVDERQEWTKNRGIAHFMKRLLPYFGYVANPNSNLKCDNIAFPGTPELDSDYLKSMVSLAVPSFTGMNKHQILLEKDFKKSNKAEPLIFEKLLIPHRRHTYFRDLDAAQQFREKAWEVAGVDSSKKRSKGNICFYQRDPNEGKGRSVANEEKLIKSLKAAVAKHSDWAKFSEISCNSHMSWKQQVRVWANCDTVLSAHGSHNINMMFMRPGSTFVEMNPKMFFYEAYPNLASTTGLAYIGLRDSEWQSDKNDSEEDKNKHSKSMAVVQQFIDQGVDDVKCQEITACRTQSRNIPFAVNEQSFNEATTMVFRKLKKLKKQRKTADLSISDMQQLDVLEENSEETSSHAETDAEGATYFKQPVKPVVQQATFVPRQTAFGTALPEIYPKQQTASLWQHDGAPTSHMMFL